MSEAPERIWAWWDDVYDVGVLNEHGDKRYTPNDAKEYVRADRIEELEAKLAKAFNFIYGDMLSDCIELIDELYDSKLAAAMRTTLAELTGESK